MSDVVNAGIADIALTCNRMQTSYPVLCAHGLFEEQVKRTPQRIAVRFEQHQMTYDELNAKANQLAHHLIALGVGPEVLVAISVERSIEMLIGVLGILKAGGAYVPLDPAYPRDRLSFMLEDSRAGYLLTQKQLLSQVPRCSGRTILIDDESSIIETRSTDDPSSPVGSRNLAYVLYTSGSTGKPKGVQIEHRSLVNFLTSMARKPGISADDILLAVTTLSFDIAGLELYLPLSVGACVAIVSRQTAADGEELLQAINGYGASVLQATPVTWRLLLDAGWRNSNLKVLVGGEALARDLARRLVKNSPSVWNLYGPTESTIWSSVYKVSEEDDRAVVPIGRPISNTQLYILESELKPAVPGEIGELVIGGHGLARGYLNRPELTAEKFIPNPFDPGTRLYRTGDLARLLPSGDIEFLGRADHQVKIRGFRIELGEIESALEEQPEIKQAVVSARDVNGEGTLVAYFTTDLAVLAPATLRQRLKRTLPEHMVPRAFVRLHCLPLTNNGKVDRRALPEPAAGDFCTEISFAAPRDGLERELTAIWGKVLGVNRIGIRDNFFELGGYSLLAVKVMRRVEEACGTKLPIVALFQAPTVEKLADLIRHHTVPEEWSSLVLVQEGGAKPPLFCVHGVFGEVLGFRDLARHLGADQPVYGLQARGLDGTTPCLTRVEDMAAAYIKEIQQFQPEGPYYLGGFSFGGAIAFEMAIQLVGRGEEVGMLAMIDTYPPNYQVTGTALSKFLRCTPRQQLMYLKRKLTYWKDCVFEFISAQFLPARLKRVRRACGEARRNYVPKRYPGSALLFRAKERPLGTAHDLYLGWDQLAEGGVEVREIPGDHLSIIDEPQVTYLSTELRAFLDKAYERNHRAVFERARARI